MRSLLLALLVLPFFTSAQINRSAKQLASERIQEYVTNKLFKHKEYKPVSYGEIKEVGHKKKTDIVWMITHQFEITEGGEGSYDRSTKTQHPYKFLFYMNEKMKVIKAEVYYTN